MAFGGPAEVLKLIQAERPMLAIDKDEIEVELPQNVNHPWGWEGKVVAVCLASRTHGGFDSVGLLHRISSSVRRLRSDRPILSVFGPLIAAELCTGRSQSSKMRCKAPNGQRLYRAEGGRRDAPLFESIEKGLCRLEIGRVEPLNRSKTKTTISAAAEVSFSCYTLSA